MNKTIIININSKKDLFDTYNNKEINDKLIAHLIKEAFFVSKKDNLTIKIYNKTKEKINIGKLIKERLKREYDGVIIEHHTNNLTQFILFIIGVTILVIAKLYNHLIWHDVLVIIGWVPIWEMVDIEIFGNINEKRLKKVITKLLVSKIIIN